MKTCVVDDCCEFFCGNGKLGVFFMHRCRVHEFEITFVWLHKNEEKKMTTVFYLPEAPAHILQEHRHDGREEQEEDHEERQFPVFFSQCSTQLSG